MKITRSRNFHGSQEKISGEEDRFHLPPMGFLPSETRLEIFFDFELFERLVSETACLPDSGPNVEDKSRDKSKGANECLI